LLPLAGRLFPFSSLETLFVSPRGILSSARHVDPLRGGSTFCSSKCYNARSGALPLAARCLDLTAAVPLGCRCDAHGCRRSRLPERLEFMVSFVTSGTGMPALARGVPESRHGVLLAAWALGHIFSGWVALYYEGVPSLPWWLEIPSFSLSCCRLLLYLL